MKKIICLIFIALLCSASAFALSRREENVNTQISITVAAAASLRNVFEQEIIPLFEQRHPEINVNVIYDSSGTLQTQISFGLQSDIFISSSPLQMNALLENSHIINESVKPFVENRIVLIKTAEINSDVESFETITNADSIAIGNPSNVSAGEYAREIFTRLGIWEDVLAKTTFADNVREVLFWVSEGITEVGVVYVTDAFSTNEVEIIELYTQGIYAIYFIGILSQSSLQTEAQTFIDFLFSDESLYIFRKYGFD